MSEFELRGARDGSQEAETGPPPIFSATLWPHRSLSRGGFGWVMAVATIGLATPLVFVLGTAALWVLAGFALLDLALLFGFIHLTYRSGRVIEEISIWSDRLRVVRTDPNGAERVWEANPHWVTVRLVPTQRIEDYLMLSSAGRDIELGAFLTPAERRDLAARIQSALRSASAPAL